MTRVVHKLNLLQMDSGSERVFRFSHLTYGVDRRLRRPYLVRARVYVSRDPHRVRSMYFGSYSPYVALSSLSLVF